MVSYSVDPTTRIEDAGTTAAADVLLVPWMVAGVQTQFEQMRRTPGFRDAQVVEVRPYRQGGLIERLPLPSSLRGTIRSTFASARAMPKRRIRAVWTQVALPMLPFVLARNRVGVYYAIDCTPILLHRSGHYDLVDDPATPQGRLTAACLRLFFQRCAGLLPWSEWAARSMVQDYGARPETVHVVPPGIDVDEWIPVGRSEHDRPVLLFVGGDFERKGGPMLLDIYRRHLRDECDLNLVTRSAIQPEPGVRVYRDLTVGDRRLRELYQNSDVLVIPTHADCFSMAALEAMACGLPVVTSDVGGIPEIVIDAETGILIPAGRGHSLLQALQTIVTSAELRSRLGQAGRRRAEEFFDAAKQSETTLRIMSATIAKDASRH